MTTRRTASKSSHAGIICETDRSNLHDLQSGILHPRPSPYVGTYIVYRVDDRARRPRVHRTPGRVGRIGGRLVGAGAGLADGDDHLPGSSCARRSQASLDSFPDAFKEGMAARAELLGDTGDSAPEHWERPLGTPDVHVALAAIAPDAARLNVAARGHRAEPSRPRRRRRDLAAGLLLAADRTRGVRLQGRHQPSGDRGQRHSRQQPEGAAVQSRRVRPRLPQRDGRRAADAAARSARPQRHVRRLSQAAPGCRGVSPVSPRQRDRTRRTKNCSPRSSSAAGAAARRSRCRPTATIPRSAPMRRATTTSSIEDDDPRGLKCPIGSHIRRMNPRDAVVTGDVRLHRMIRRGTNYGPHMPEGVLEDDGADRGLCFVFVGASLTRQFEFVQTQWVNDGRAFGAPAEKDPLVGATAAARSPFPRARSAAGCRDCRASSPRAAASTASRRR